MSKDKIFAVIQVFDGKPIICLENTINYEVINSQEGIYIIIEREKRICNIGDILYGVYLRPLQVRQMQVREITAMTNDIFYHTQENSVGFRGSMIGKTVFLTEEEANKKVKELQNNDTIDNTQKEE